jgi:hypothetical protein
MCRPTKRCSRRAARLSSDVMRRPNDAATVFTYLLLVTGGCTPVRYSHTLPPTQPLPQPLSIQHPGTVLHEASGYRFPERVAGFERVGATVFDVQHQQIAIGYDRETPGCRTTATVFLDPAPLFVLATPSEAALGAMKRLILDRAYDARKATVRQVHPAIAGLVEDSAATTPAGGTVLRGRSLTFQEGHDTSEMHVFLLSTEWILTYRFTYPRACTDQAAGQLNELRAGLPL